MKIFSSKKRVAAIGAVTAITLAGGGMAAAYWTTTGTGTGQATTGTATAFLVDFDRDGLGNLLITGDPLSPGGSTQTTHVTVTNPGPGSQRLTQVVVDVEDNGGCGAENFVVNGQTSVYGQATIDIADVTLDAADAEVLPVSVHMRDTGVDQDVCQGKTLTLTAVAS